MASITKTPKVASEPSVLPTARGLVMAQLDHEADKIRARNPELSHAAAVGRVMSEHPEVMDAWDRAVEVDREG